jgi:hypothetical protein
MVNRYRIEVRHPDQDGTDVEVIADDEAAALEQAQAAAPEGSTLLRIVALEIDYVAPVIDPPPVSTDPTGSGARAGFLRSSGVGSEPRLHDDDDDAPHKPRRHK